MCFECVDLDLFWKRDVLLVIGNKHLKVKVRNPGWEQSFEN